MFGDFICGNYEKQSINDCFSHGNQHFDPLNQPYGSSIYNQRLSNGSLMSDVDRKFFSDWEDIIICYDIANWLS